MMTDKIDIVCMESEAFYRLLENVLQRLQPSENKQSDKWISGLEAMRLLRIKSKATLQKMRDEGRFRFSQPEKKIILYDADSIMDYLEDFVYEPFSISATHKRKV
jgi:hypothetical protein